MSRYEQPNYDVLEQGRGYEIRSYDSYLVAETTVVGTVESTGSEAFRRLAGFIFGRNSQSKKMAMTVPVTRMDDESGGYRYRFVMERAYDENTLPQPLDGSVSVARVPAGVFAAIKYRGGREERLARRATASLLLSLERDAVEITGDPFTAIYSGPFVPPPLRRNEILVPVAWPPTSAEALDQEMSLDLS